MIEDHLGVVDETGAAAERAHSRLWELLDREILPCLERPGRQLGPFDLPLRASTGHSNVALIWPSSMEGVQAPAALRPWFEIVASLRRLQPSLAGVPAADLEHALETRRLPLFGRPQWTPLAEHPLWIVPLDEPLDLLGLLTILRASRLPLRAIERGGVPAIVLTGEGALRLGDLGRVFADAVIAREQLTKEWFARLEAAAGSEGTWLDAVREAGLGREGRAGALLAPAAPLAPLGGVEATVATHGPRRDEVAALLVRGREGLRRPLRERIAGRSKAFTDRLWIGSASAGLRERHALVQGDAIVRALRETFAAEAGSAALDFVWGLPGETEADRAALAPLLDAIVAAAPRGVRQVRARLGWYIPSAEERAAGTRPISAAVAEAALARLQAESKSRRLRIDTVAASRAEVAALLEGAAASFAPVLECVHGAGARTADAPAAGDAELWRVALRASGQEAVWSVEVAPSAAVAPAPHGFVWKSVATANPPRTDSARRKVRTAGHGDRWTRWQDLVPRQFDVRIEFAKLGRMRLLGSGELTDLFLGALERAHLPLATSGLVEPKPRISFGPSLPANVAGEREVVDLGLTQPAPDLLDRLRRELPPGIELRAVVALPPHAPQLALGQIALAEYAVDIDPGHFVDAQARASTLERLQSWRRRIQAGSPCVDEPDDVLNQLRDLQLSASPDGPLALRFTLDLRDPGPKCKPRDVLSRGLGDLRVDVRCLPLRRLRLLVLAEEPARVVVTTPFELVQRASRRQRARAKFSA